MAKTSELNFDDIMAYCGNNTANFESLCGSCSQIVPFVGAGLSAFAYPCWHDFLTETAKCLNGNSKSEFENEIRNKDYERAASVLEKYLGEERFRRDIIKEFGEQRLFEQDIESKIREQAVFLLPRLFKKLVLTTNFDRTLEHVYEISGEKFKNVGHPCGASLLYHALEQHTGTTLYKFHGDIGQPENLVLTKERYDKCYSENSPLVRGLRACFKQKSMLFLGCSMETDRTMNVLQEVLQNNSCHYAILGCEEKEVAAKSLEMKKHQIHSILYPVNEHGAVRTILQALVEHAGT